MLLSHKTSIRLNATESNIVGHMCYAAYKLWNVCNYERRNYKELGMEKYPDWYDQKSRLKDNLWFKSLPSQTAQEVCKLLDKSWKSFYALVKSQRILNPNPPRFKQKGMAITYMQNAIVHDSKSSRVRLSLPKQLKDYLCQTYDICEKYLYLENKVFQNTDNVKQIKIYPPDHKGVCQIIIIYEIKDTEIKSDNGHYLSIDLGLHNLITCYDSIGKSFILGRKYLEINQKYDKEIARLQHQWGRAQAAKGIKYPKPSHHLCRVYEKKKNCIHDYLHKVTRVVADYCEENHIHTVIIGDIKNIRRNKKLGKITNQKLHALPYDKIYAMLGYKLAMYGIALKKQTEEYTSQCSPYAPKVSKQYAEKSNRKNRGLYKDQFHVFNADVVGAYNIMRKYNTVSGVEKKMSVSGLSSPEIIKVAV
ncbi:RNA-guided endonuclease InsQ/TnpB family protein [Hespellia stercorisuis]|uniref:Putative transposase n=1 Tax=Hespellia stercorisuis DSM 15480 TaxID=1121950 RepID=A0A1M6NX71_9FIRM|nr:RNA-guided endonuclease TnpB family protein [Hespellia stercorisuis]SHK00276.1 putative transposase [Hespellia stercorisuis DSM 15480]